MTLLAAWLEDVATQLISSLSVQTGKHPSLLFLMDEITSFQAEPLKGSTSSQKPSPEATPSPQGAWE